MVKWVQSSSAKTVTDTMALNAMPFFFFSSEYTPYSSAGSSTGHVLFCLACLIKIKCSGFFFFFFYCWVKGSLCVLTRKNKKSHSECLGTVCVSKYFRDRDTILTGSRVTRTVQEHMRERERVKKKTGTCRFGTLPLRLFFMFIIYLFIYSFVF